MTRSVWLLLLMVSGTALAGWQDSVPGAQAIGGGDLRLYGFRIYTARLLSASKPLRTDQPFALELTYHRAISRDDLVDASIDEIKRISGNNQPLDLWRQQMQQSFVDVSEGTKIIGVYLPGQEARFYVGEQLQHVVRDPRFAKAFFDIWLDPKTRNPALREQLLGAGS